METKIKSFNELSLKEYHEILAERTRVFVVEQNCPYQEVDDIDLTAVHFWYEEADQIIAYARIYEVDKKFHFGRVLVKKEFRRQGYARRLLTEVLEWIEENSRETEIRIEAQVYLQDFYHSLGFGAVSDPFLLDDIWHIEMKRCSKKSW